LPSSPIPSGIDLIRLSPPHLESRQTVNNDCPRGGRRVIVLATVPLANAGREDSRGGRPRHQPRKSSSPQGIAGYLQQQHEHPRGQNWRSREPRIPRQLRRELSRLYDAGVLVLDPGEDRAIIGAELLLGYTGQEVIGERAENILISPDRLTAVLASAAEGVSTPNLETITLHHRDGQTFTADVKVLSYALDDNSRGVVVIVKDVSEHEQIRIQTRQLEQRALLGEFMGVFAHEVLNPINSISMGAQMLARRLGPADPNYEVINRIENDCQRLHHQMEALKSYAKPYEPLQEPVDLRGLLVRIIERWRPRMSRVNVSPLYQIPETLPKVIGDWRALEQVFTNLISNAIDAMSQNGGILSVKVDVSSDTADRRQVEVAVTDNGPGIPDEIRGRIFEPFVTTKSTGTGLGLAITKRIVTAHRGVITVNSFPGGTVFTVFLPANEDDD